MWSKTLTQAHTTASASYITRLLPVLREVETRFADTIRLGELASSVHLHPTYFCTLFKQTTGYSPLQYLARFRLEHACALLIATELPLEDIASRTGFYDAAHLIRVFRRDEGDVTRAVSQIRRTSNLLVNSYSARGELRV